MTADRIEPTAGPADHRAPRLDPFAFISDTTPRFWLLLAVTVTAQWYAWFGMAVTLQLPSLQVLFQPDTYQDFFRCVDQSSTIPESQSCFLPLVAHLSGPMWTSVGLALLAGTVALAATVALMVRLAPAWMIRQRRLTPLSAEDAPEVAAALSTLCEVAGLARSPRFYWNPLDPAPRALAFGSNRRPRVALTGALAVRLYTDPGLFRAVMLHELAHLRNGDVGRTYTAMALWRAHVLTGLIPYLALALWITPYGWWDRTATVLQAAALTALVFLSRNAILRARELYADARASTWVPAADGLARALASLRPGRRWPRALSVHPDPRRRQRLLESTDQLFLLGAWDAFAIGFATVLAGHVAFIALLCSWLAITGGDFMRVVNDLGLIFGVSTQASSSNLVVALLIVQIAIPAPTVVAMTCMVWRACFLATARGSQPRGIGRAGLAFSLGVCLGYLVFFQLATLGNLTDLSSAGPKPLPPQPAWLVALGAAAVVLFASAALATPIVLFLKWVEACALAWLPVTLRRASLGPIVATGIGFCSILALPWFSGLAPILILLLLMGIWHALETGLLSGPLGPLAPLIVVGVIYPFNLIAWFVVVVPWALPFAAALVPVRWSGIGAWGFLSSVPAMAAPLSPLRPLRALLIGLGGGAIFGVALGWFHIDVPAAAVAGLLRQKVDLQVPSDAILGLSLITTSWAAQAMLAALGALSVPKLRVVHAMAVCFVSGCVLSIAAAAHVVLLGEGAAPFLTIVDVCLPAIVVGGGVLAFPAALAVSLTAGGIAALAKRRSSYRA